MPSGGVSVSETDPQTDEFAQPAEHRHDLAASDPGEDPTTNLLDDERRSAEIESASPTPRAAAAGSIVGASTIAKSESVVDSPGRDFVNTRPPALDMLADSPLTTDSNDQLDFAAYADALAELLENEKTDTPLTIAISASWGAGKTSLANMVTTRLVDRPIERGDRPHIVCWFNAWLHDDAPHLGAAFAAEVAKTVNHHRFPLRRFFSPLASAMLSPEQRWRRRIFIGVGSLAVAVIIALVPDVRSAAKPDLDIVDAIRTVNGRRWAAIAVAALLVLAIWRKLFAAAQTAARFIDDPKSEAANGSMQQVREQLGGLIRQGLRNPGRFGNWLKRTWPEVAKFSARFRGRRRLILVVDDLERCRPPRGVEVCEVASQLLGHSDVMAILVADMSTLAASAEIKYSQLETLPGPSLDANSPPVLAKGTYGRAYLQKIVQLQFDLPPANLARVRQIITSEIDKPAKPRPHKTRAVIRLWRSLDQWGPPCYLVAVFLVLATTSDLGVIKAVGVVGLILPFLAVASDINEVSRSNRRGRVTERIDREIESRATETGNPESVKAAVLESEAAREGGRGLANQRLERFLVDNQLLRVQAESEVLKFLPAVPRSAKRLANHLRLLLAIASQRNMLGGDPALQPAHLGKWAVLLQRWPEMGSAIRADPAIVADLEKAARSNSSTNTLTEFVGAGFLDVTDITTATAFLKSEPSLAAVAHRLVYCTPAHAAFDE
jgi:KAP family P-loop domain